MRTLRVNLLAMPAGLVAVPGRADVSVLVMRVWVWLFTFWPGLVSAAKETLEVGAPDQMPLSTRGGAGAVGVLGVEEVVERASGFAGGADGDAAQVCGVAEGGGGGGGSFGDEGHLFGGLVVEVGAAKLTGRRTL